MRDVSCDFHNWKDQCISIWSPAFQSSMQGNHGVVDTWAPETKLETHRRNDKGDQTRGENMDELCVLRIRYLARTDTETPNGHAEELPKELLEYCLVKCCTNGGDKIHNQPPNMRCIPRA